MSTSREDQVLTTGPHRRPFSARATPTDGPIYYDNPAWMDDAVCAQIGDDTVWFPDKGQSTRAAKSVCATCPVINECLEYALERNERYGVYGGHSERERRAIKDARQAA